MRSRTTYLVIVLCLAPFLALRSQSQETTPTVDASPDGVWEWYDTDDGLANTMIHDIAVGSDGTVWAFTRTGMSYFDGDTWTTLHDISEQYLKRGWVKRTIAVAPDGTVWASGVYAFGLARYDGATWTFFIDDRGKIPEKNSELFRRGLSDSCVRDVVVGHDGTVWAGTYRGWSGYDGNKWTIWNTSDGLVADAIVALAVAPDDSLWIATGGALSHFNGVDWVNYSDIHIYPLASLAVGLDHTVWIASEKLYTFDGQELHTINLSKYLKSTAAFVIDVAPDGTVWVGTKEGLSRFDGETWVNYRPDTTGFSVYILSLAIAPDGTVWGGTYGGSNTYEGVFHFTPPDVLFD